MTEHQPEGDETSSEVDGSKPSSIVGIGASAGGLAALRRLLETIPDDNDLAWVLVMHLSPEHQSHLAELLQPHTKMPVSQVTETVALRAGHVYVIPPGKNLSAVDTHLRLSELEPRRRERAPVDHFFRTLAGTHDGHAVGIILTGTGSDGTLGIKELKRFGSVTIVQDPDDAEFEGMPISAISSGLVDLVLPLEKIGPRVVELASFTPRIARTSGDAAGERDQQVVHSILTYVRARTGRDFSRFKRSTILRRIQRRMHLRQIAHLSDYASVLRNDDDEVAQLADDFLITVTNFFRDPEVFEKLEADVIPRLFEGKSAADELRVWTVGCATGEEAYSLAILLVEEAERRRATPNLQVFASDLHPMALARAREGFYPGEIEADVSSERLGRFFVKENAGYRVRREIRELVIFAPHNLLSDPPFSKLDFISCRNLLIYLQRDVQSEVMELFHYALRPSGMLLLGTSETVESSELFSMVSKSHSLYQKRNVPVPEPRLPVFPLTRSGPNLLRTDGDGAETPIHYGKLHHTMAEKYGPPSVLISPDHHVVHLSLNAGRFLVHPGGELTSNIFKLIREELRLELRRALYQAEETGEATTTEFVEMQLGDTTVEVRLLVQPAEGKQERGLALVVFQEIDSGATIGTRPDDATLEPGSRAEALATELEVTRHRLQVLIEDYETSQEEMKASNEELQSANEELRSTLEELETSKEELQSMNEELLTVNQENRHKVAELDQLTNDLHNLLTATDIATLFLDRSLRILRFTPRVSQLFNVRSTDRGRPISDLTHRLGSQNLFDDAKRVLDDLVKIEREVQDEDGRWYLTRVLPYRNEALISGVVLTFVDITQRKLAEEELRKNRESIASELAALRRLHELTLRLYSCPDRESTHAEILVAGEEIAQASMSILLLLDPGSRRLVVDAVHGLDDDILGLREEWEPRIVSLAMSGLRSRQRITVTLEETNDPQFAAFQRPGVGALQISPMIVRSGEQVGAIVTFGGSDDALTETQRHMLDLYGWTAAGFLSFITKTATPSMTLKSGADDEE